MDSKTPDSRFMIHAKKILNKDVIFRLFFYALVIAFCLIFISPFLIMITTSFKTSSDAFTVPVKILPREWILDNYPLAFQRIPYWRYMANTIFITILCVIGQLFSTPLVSYSISKINWRGSKLINSLVFSTMMIPVTVTMVPLYRVYAKLGLLNSYVPLILPSLFGSSFYIVIMRQFFRNISSSLLEAATIDGASEWQKYWRIALPLCKPVLASVGFLFFVAKWNDWNTALLYITDPKLYSLQYLLQKILNEAEFLKQLAEAGELMGGEVFPSESYRYAMALVAAGPVLCVFPFFQKYFAKGMTLGGVKG